MFASIRSALFGPLALTLLGCAGAAIAAPGSTRPATVQVDLSDAQRRLIHTRLVIPAATGPLSLVYPKWVPGEHSPTGPLADVAGLTIRAGGRVLAWKRDFVNLHKIVVEVPAGAHEVEIALDTVTPPAGEGKFSAGASMTANVAVLAWNSVLLYPEGARIADSPIRASIKLPAGWRFGTALPIESRDGDTTSFGVVSLEQLVDSPLLTGAHFADIPLGDNRGAKVTLHLAAESQEELALSPVQKAALEKLVKEEALLFGARHFGEYHFLLALSDSIPANGIEHHQSSDNRLAGQTLIDKDQATAHLVELLAHESVHSWNGKYRRPVGLAPKDFQQPLEGELLWVYEGLTQYLGSVLSARSGAWDTQTLRDHFALTAEGQHLRGGRKWRPVQDTATSAQLLYFARSDWSSLRRGVDFYAEGDLIWLEIDVRLREATGGKVTLDDFCRKFHGGGDSGPKVVTYTFDDVARGLDELAPGNDFGALLRSRLDATDVAPLEGLARAGWKLDYSEEQSLLAKTIDKTAKELDLRSSIGIQLDTEKGTILDVIPGGPADKAKVAPGSKLIAVNGRKLSPERLLAAITATKGGSARLTFLTENADTYETHALDWSGGLRYPKLVRIEGKADLLSAIAGSKSR